MKYLPARLGASLLGEVPRRRHVDGAVRMTVPAAKVLAPPIRDVFVALAIAAADGMSSRRSRWTA